MAYLVAAPVAVAKAFSPGHITGFVEKPFRISNYLDGGSKGAGFSIDRGITTNVEVYEDKTLNYQISINGIRAENAEVSSWVVKEYLKFVHQPHFINIQHNISIPV